MCMKNLVICQPNVTNSHIVLQDRFYIEEINIPIGLIDQKAPSFKANYKHKDYLLVRKDAFSCNFMDKFNIVNIFSQLIKKCDTGLLHYCPVGSEFVGTILEVGNNVDNFSIGDRVIPVAQYPEPLTPEVEPGVPTLYSSKRFQILHNSQLMRIPKEIPDEVATSLTIAGHIVYSMIEKADLNFGDRILITSLKSNISLAILSALKNKGFEIWGLTSNGMFIPQLKQLGINKVIVYPKEIKDYNNIDDLKDLIEKTGGFNVVFDAFSDLHLGKITSCMNLSSRYLSCGFFDQLKLKKMERFVVQGKEMSEIMMDCISKNISIIGNCLGEKRHLQKAIDEYKKGNFNIPIDSVITGSDIAYFFDRTFNDPGRFGKVVYKYDD